MPQLIFDHVDGYAFRDQLIGMRVPEPVSMDPVLDTSFLGQLLDDLAYVRRTHSLAIEVTEQCLATNIRSEPRTDSIFSHLIDRHDPALVTLAVEYFDMAVREV